MNSKCISRARIRCHSLPKIRLNFQDYLLPSLESLNHKNLNVLVAECVPDRVRRVPETIIRNRFDCMIIISKYSMHFGIESNFQSDMVTGSSRLESSENSPYVSLESTATSVLLHYWAKPRTLDQNC